MVSEHERCECHECTQARYRLSFEWQLDQAFRPMRQEEKSPLEKELDAFQGKPA